MDSTALKRQNRRLQRLKERGISRSTVLVHDDCRPAFEALKPHLADARKAGALDELSKSLQARTRPTNVAQVRHLSPFRYPGGKTWLVPEVRQWLLTLNSDGPPSLFVEPFAGGAITGLTVAAEGLAHEVFLSELDEDVAVVWETIFDGSDAEVEDLCHQILSFEVTLDNVREILERRPRAKRNKAFQTIVKNRMQRGGIMAPGAGLVKAGEAGRGLLSRWYPETLVKRIQNLRTLKDAVTFERTDAFEVIKRFSHIEDAVFFIDPPYTAGGKRAGSRLYAHNAIDHNELFALMSRVKGSVMMTYDDAPEVRELASLHGFRIEEVPMKNTHHRVLYELLIMKP